MLVVIESNVFIIREAAAQSFTYHDKYHSGHYGHIVFLATPFTSSLAVFLNCSTVFLCPVLFNYL